ncbi:glycosyltransferase [Bacteroidales bacterium OttesenSCG-928-M06]|nr:glycosyltransferase [Bacteroidales bacterium OttesenSCG-928-M06]
MKNIYILDEYKSSTQNGIGTFLRELVKCFTGHNICLIEFNSNEKLFDIKTVNDIREMHFPSFQRNGFLTNYKIIDKFLRLYIKDSPDNLFMLNHSPCEKLLKTIRTAFPLSKITFTIHDLGWTYRLSGDFNLLKNIILKEKHKKIKTEYQSVIDYFHEEQRMYETADKVICLSKDTYRFLQEVYLTDRNKISLIPNGLIDNYTPVTSSKKQKMKIKMGINPCEKILLTAGRITSAKGIPNLLNAFSEVVKKYPNCRLVVIGHVYDPGFILKLSKQDAAKVSYTGLISKDELANWYHIADIGIIPSLSEQCSYTGIEMMMHKLPIVASDGFGVRNMFQDGINARIASIGNRKKPKEYKMNLTEAILELLFSEELCLQLGKEARQTYESCYTPEKMQEGYKMLLEEISEKYQK